MTVCTLCKCDKASANFSPDKRLKSGTQSRCKMCLAEVARLRRIANPLAHRESVKKSTKAHYAKKLTRNEAYRNKNSLKVQQWKKKDRCVNKTRILADNAMRRAKLKSIVSHEIRQIYALRDFYKAMSLGDDFHVDHIIPLSKNGTHSIENLQVIPAIDNLRKGGKTLENIVEMRTKK